jgi:hypothetical protein
VIDAGFLELVRLGVLAADDPDVANSVSIVDHVIEHSTSNGPGFYRYGTNSTKSADGYGDRFQPSLSTCKIQGEPWPTNNTGTGHLWPVLSGERGEYDIANSDRAGASALLTAIAKMTSGHYLEPEQVWENADLPASGFESDPTTASIGFKNGSTGRLREPPDLGAGDVRAAGDRPRHDDLQLDRRCDRHDHTKCEGRRGGVRVPRRFGDVRARRRQQDGDARAADRTVRQGGLGLDGHRRAHRT